MERILYTADAPGVLLDVIIAEASPASLFILADENTAVHCMPVLLGSSESAAGATLLVTPAGDGRKTLDAAESLWHRLVDAGATRSSMLVNLGGGMVSDLGGFVASTFKRGMRYVNVPTTLLGAVDAAVGGKTGINFAGLKNEVGVFARPESTIVSTCFFATLPQQELLSGYAEMLKHALLSGTDATARALSEVPDVHVGGLLDMMRESISCKELIVASDPTEKGPRKALNLGHTFGHAFEEFASERRRPVSHGHAVAMGIVAELVLSRMIYGFPASTLYAVAAFVRENYAGLDVSCDDYPRLLGLMAHDKKNASPDAISFSLLHAPGSPAVDSIVNATDIRAALDIYRDLMQ